jgi:ABC-type multidrug transport system ATPase subunit
METALERVGLWDVLCHRAGAASALDIPASQLSGGERKRLQLARTLLGRPQLVILDEPEAGLDEASRRWLRSLLDELATSTRLLVIAHDPNVISDAFTRLTCEAKSAITS